MVELNQDYWSKRYQEGSDGWDLGSASPPLVHYFDQLSDEWKEKRILIPGCGRAYEAEYLFRKGFKKVFVVDFAAEPLAELKYRMPNFPSDQLIQDDFFCLKGSFDLIVEQTMFCAISPEKRADYIEKVAQLLTPGGKFVGLLFNRDFQSGPPFGGSKSDYIPLFQNHFESFLLEDCHNSVAPRLGFELFFVARKSFVI
jgi:methyl halide transferase